MVYRYESDGDILAEYPESGSDRVGLAVGSPPPAGPSPSRFPSPSLPRASQVAPPVSEPPAAAIDDDPPAPPLPPPRAGRGPGQLWQVVFGAAAVLALLALCGLAAAALLGERTPQPQAGSGAQPGAASSPATESASLDSRDTDQAPLTVREVFPGATLTLPEGRPAYGVLKTQSSGSCAVAASGEAADLLARLGCSQVVRATLRTSDGEHLVTAGLFNLTDHSSAERARDRIRQVLDERQGRIRGLAVVDETEPIVTAPARVGWQVRGHYLAYALIVRSDGQPIRSSDATVREILVDLIERHLNQGVLEHRADSGWADQPILPQPDGGSGTGNGDSEEQPRN